MPSVVPLFLIEQLRITLESGFTVIWLAYWASRDKEQLAAALISQPRLPADEASVIKRREKIEIEIQKEVKIPKVPVR